MGLSFLDSNILLYIASSDPAKADRAEALVAGGGHIGVQVLNEVTAVARRKMGLSWAQINAFLSAIRGLLTVNPITIEIHESGLILAERYGFPIHDAMIAASALDAGCETLWSEDFQDGMLISGRLRVENPFKS
jgi:predicted nucleic acid-binding protein